MECSKRKEAGKYLRQSRCVLRLCLLFLFLTGLQPFFGQLGKHDRQDAGKEHNQRHERLNGNGSADCKKEAADLKVNLAERCKILLLNGVHIVVDQRKEASVVCFALFRRIECFNLPHGIGSQIAPHTLNNDVACVIH